MKGFEEAVPQPGLSGPKAAKMAEECKDLLNKVATKAEDEARDAMSQRGAGQEANAALERLEADCREALDLMGVPFLSGEAAEPALKKADCYPRKVAALHAADSKKVSHQCKDDMEAAEKMTCMAECLGA